MNSSCITHSLKLNETNCPTYYPPEYRAVAVTLFSIILIEGLIGNVLVVIVVLKTRSMHTPTNCYLLSLALADCLVLMSATLPAIPEYFFRLDEWRYGSVMCHVMTFVQYMGGASSALSITAFTVERYIAVCHPIKAQTLCTVERAKRIIIGLWIFTILYSSPWIFLTVIEPRVYSDGNADVRCTFRYKRDNYRYYYMLDLGLFYLLPIVITTVLYGLICKVLLSARVPSNSPVGCTKSRHTRSGTARNQVIRMLCVVVILFVILWMPYRVWVVYNSFVANDFLDLWYIIFCRTLVYINSAINPILYNAMSVKFRRAFRQLLCCRGYEPQWTLRMEQDYTVTTRSNKKSSYRCSATATDTAADDV